MIDKIEQYISSRKIYNRSCYQWQAARAERRIRA